MAVTCKCVSSKMLLHYEHMVLILHFPSGFGYFLFFNFCIFALCLMFEFVILGFWFFFHVSKCLIQVSNGHSFLISFL